MRTIKNSRGESFGLHLSLADVRRLKAGVEIEPNRVFAHDFDYLDNERLKADIDRICSSSLFAVELMYALLPAERRQQISFSQFIGEGAADEPWQPRDLLLAAQEVAGVVLDFFQLRIADASVIDKGIRVQVRAIQQTASALNELTQDQVELLMVTGVAELNQDLVAPLMLELKGGASREDVLKKLDALLTNSGPKSGDSLASPASPTSDTSVTENFTSSPPVPGN